MEGSENTIYAHKWLTYAKRVRNDFNLLDMDTFQEKVLAPTMSYLEKQTTLPKEYKGYSDEQLDKVYAKMAVEFLRGRDEFKSLMMVDEVRKNVRRFFEYNGWMSRYVSNRFADIGGFVVDEGLNVQKARTDTGRYYLGHSATRHPTTIRETLRDLVSRMAETWSGTKRSDLYTLEADPTTGQLVAIATGGMSAKVVMDMASRNDIDSLVEALDKRYTDTIILDFLEPLLELDHSIFLDMEKNQTPIDRNLVLKAYRKVRGRDVSNGRIILDFLSELHDITPAYKPGDAESKLKFVATGLNTLQTQFDEIQKIFAPNQNNRGLQMDSRLASPLMNARKFANMPHQWKSPMMYTPYNLMSLNKILALNGGLGHQGETWRNAMKSLEESLGAMSTRWNEAVRSTNQNKSLTRAERKKLLTETAQTMFPTVEPSAAYKNADRLNKWFKNAKRVQVDIGKMASQNGDISGDFKTTLIWLQMISGNMVNRPRSAITDFLSVIPSLMMHFRGSAPKALLKTGKNTVAETAAMMLDTRWAGNALVDSVGQMLGMNLRMVERARIMNTRLALGEEQQQISLKESIARKQPKDDPSVPTGGGEGFLSKHLSTIPLAIKRILGAAVRTKIQENPDEAAGAFQLFSPFYMLNTIAHRAVARTYMEMISETMERGVAFLESGSADAQMALQMRSMGRVIDPDSGRYFMITPDHLLDIPDNYEGATMQRTKYDHLMTWMRKYGIPPEELMLQAYERKQRDGEKSDWASSWMEDQGNLDLVRQMITEHIFQDASLTSRPGWMLRPGLRAFTPLIGWSIYRPMALVKAFGEGKVRDMNWQEFRRGMLVMAFAVLPFGLALAFMRDWYDREIEERPRRIIPPGLIFHGEGWQRIKALASSFSDSGALGIPMDFANSIINMDTARPFKVSDRVVALNWMNSIMDTLRDAVMTNFTIEQSQAINTIFQTAGMGGYLEMYNTIATKLGSEDAVVKKMHRLGTDNLIFAAAQLANVETKSPRGGDGFAPKPTTSYINRMAFEAYMDDYDGVMTYYKKAVRIAESMGEEDPARYVASTFKSRHPFRRIIKGIPSPEKWNEILRLLGDKADGVESAISNFEKYAAIITPATRSSSSKSTSTAYTMPRTTRGLPRLPRLPRLPTFRSGNSYRLSGYSQPMSLTSGQP